MRVEVSEGAKQDIEEAAVWYEDRDEGCGIRFISEVHKAIVSLPERTLIRRLQFKGFRIGWILTEHFPYRIIYRLCDADGL